MHSNESAPEVEDKEDQLNPRWIWKYTVPSPDPPPALPPFGRRLTRQELLWILETVRLRLEGENGQFSTRVQIQKYLASKDMSIRTHDMVWKGGLWKWASWRSGLIWDHYPKAGWKRWSHIAFIKDEKLAEIRARKKKATQKVRVLGAERTQIGRKISGQKAHIRRLMAQIKGVGTKIKHLQAKSLEKKKEVLIAKDQFRTIYKVYRIQRQKVVKQIALAEAKRVQKELGIITYKYTYNRNNKGKKNNENRRQLPDRTVHQGQTE